MTQGIKHMLKVASNSAAFGYLRDIRVSVSKSDLNGANSNGNGDGNHQSVIEAAEEALRARDEAGYERGRHEAEEAHKKHLQEVRQQWQEEWETAHRGEVIRILEGLNRSVQHQMSDAFKALEKHAVMLAAEAAIKLTSGIPLAADVVEAYVREALNLVEQDTEVAIILNPQDLAMLEQHQSSLLNRAGGKPVIKFRADEKIGRGGCLVESKFGELDARRETKIEMLRKAVNE